MKKYYEIFYSYLTPDNIDLASIISSVAGILILSVLLWQM